VETVRTIGRYRIEEWLASGAMGDVYRAYDPLIDRPVAIKLVRRELSEGSGSEQWLARFKREARAAGQRLHPNIVAILDCGEENGVPFLAMEFVDGPSLAGLLKTSGPLPLDRAAAIIAEVLSGLGFAHANGIVHRDIKPSNIIVPAIGPVKIADFGIARTDASDLTVVGDVLGTPAYMAPEQLRGEPIDNRSDLFAVGVMFFEVLTGVKPFRGKTMVENLSLMERGGPADICQLNPLVPPAMKRVIERALAFDPARRFASAAEFAAVLSASADRVGAAAAGIAARQPEAGGTLLDAGLVHQIERDLATFIGPLATLAVKRSLGKARDLDTLYQSLAHYIDGEGDRRRFLETGRRRAAGASERTGGSPSLIPTSAATALGPPEARLPTPEILADLEASLAHIIGPIAKILIKRHLRHFETLPKLYQALAADIPNERDRAAFLASRKQK
jgi:serine/threonine-protein kinase